MVLSCVCLKTAEEDIRGRLPLDFAENFPNADPQLLHSWTRDLNSSIFSIGAMSNNINIPEDMSERVQSIPLFQPSVEHEPMDALPELENDS